MQFRAARVDCRCGRSGVRSWRPGALGTDRTLCCSFSGLGKPKVTRGRVPSSACRAAPGCPCPCPQCLQSRGNLVALTQGLHWTVARAHPEESKPPLLLPGVLLERQRDGREGSTTGVHREPPASILVADSEAPGDFEAPTTR